MLPGERRGNSARNRARISAGASAGCCIAARFHLGRIDLELSDRGRDARGRPRAQRLGHLWPEGPDRQSRHRRRRLRPLPPLSGRHRADAAARRCRPTAFRSPGRACCRRGAGTPNERGLAFYDRLIDAILAAGIEPWLCLYHWDMPQALDDLGGWTTRDCVAWFADYAALVADRYGDRVKRFATFNEPSIFTLFGYGFGGGKRDTSGRRVAAPRHPPREPRARRGGRCRARARAGQLDRRHPQRPALPAVDAGRRGGGRSLRRLLEWAYPDPQCLGSYPPLDAGGDRAAHASRRPCAHPPPARLVRPQSLQPGLREGRRRMRGSALVSATSRPAFR